MEILQTLNLAGPARLLCFLVIIFFIAYGITLATEEKKKFYKKPGYIIIVASLIALFSIVATLS